ncbi:hypothetical protein EXIGLDRAFT_521483 [Exidia glandulosa HHB12029]|uniref:Uncharacterized protein n=1 Tax=Exidia glandulosa HHB12029 TaxID=1314781 RepID=A0A165Z1Q4_EXIGL|nr:hypothetical protein EXIGLDRAFT_521483 [Exidia glandulosa HHB12029]
MGVAHVQFIRIAGLQARSSGRCARPDRNRHRRRRRAPFDCEGYGREGVRESERATALRDGPGCRRIVPSPRRKPNPNAK